LDVISRRRRAPTEMRSLGLSLLVFLLGGVIATPPPTPQPFNQFPERFKLFCSVYMRHPGFVKKIRVFFFALRNSHKIRNANIISQRNEISREI
jgi:hypothetical protein